MTLRIGVILAAGRGRRYGGSKQLSMWPSADGSKSLVAAAYDAIRPICDDMIIVLGHEAEAVAAALGDRRFHQVPSNADASMFESIRAGLRAAQVIDAAATVVLQPGDQPEVAAATLDALVARSLKRPHQAVVPQVGDRGGHPALIPPQIVSLLVSASCPQGLGEYWLRHPELCERMPVDDLTALRDVDTPDDLNVGS
jgi:molybdenum cofactor cytidylyltransferase